ncbi:MAG: tRNA lysidine(34) synthetase TilS [Legionellales bacterium]
MTKLLLSPQWLLRLEKHSKLIVGFSGGLDSTVLLHLLASHTLLRHKLVAVHVNHGISMNAPLWQNHCAQFCVQVGVDFIAQAVEFDRLANVEEGARIARYGVFSSMLTAHDCLILAHHLNDQAETVLLQLFRGAGVDGLAAMAEFSDLASGSLARPLLTHFRADLEHYAAGHQLHWIEDESNADVRFSRNYLRQQVMPLLIEKWPGVVAAVARTATHCRQAKANLDNLAIIDEQTWSLPINTLSMEPLKALNDDRIANTLRYWLKKNQVQLPSTAILHCLIHEVIRASSDATPVVSWDKVQVRRYQQQLYLDRKKSTDLQQCIDWTAFPQPLNIIAASMVVCAQQANHGLFVPEGAKIQIKFRQGGEVLKWHGQTKKLKKLVQEWAIPPWLREQIPLLYINDQLAAVIGYAVSDAFFSPHASNAWLITRRALD